MKIEINNKPLSQFAAEQNVKAIVDNCKTLIELYIKTNDEIDVELLMQLQDFIKFVIDFENEIK